MYIKENGENTASMHSEKFLSRTHGEISKKMCYGDFEKNVLPEKLLVQRSHGISDKKNIREKIGRLSTAAWKREDTRNLLS